MTDYHQFIITTPDMHTIDLEPFQYSGTNITGIRLVDPESPIMQQITNFMNETQTLKEEEMLEGCLCFLLLHFSQHYSFILKKYIFDYHFLGLTAAKMQIQTALIYDGIILLTEAFKQLNPDQIRPKKLNCNNFTSWENGNSITNFMRNV